MKNLFLVLAVVFTLTVPILVSAEVDNAPANKLSLPNPFDCSTGASDTPCIIQILQGIIERLLLIIYPILAGMVFYGGLQMMFARGNTEKYKSGLKTIQYAVIGFVAIVVSQGVAAILYSLLGLGGGVP
jgi:hypothetical protein